MDFLQIGVVLALVVIFSIPMAKYLTNVYSLEITKQDSMFGKIERVIFKLSGIDTNDMRWRQYAKALLLSNLVMFIISYIIIRFQGVLPGNPSKIDSMEPLLAFNTLCKFSYKYQFTAL